MLSHSLITLTSALQVKPNILESPHHVLQLKQKGKNLVVFIHAALSNDNVQRPVNLQEITVLIILHFLLEILRLFKIQVFQQLVCILIM